MSLSRSAFASILSAQSHIVRSAFEFLRLLAQVGSDMGPPVHRRSLPFSSQLPRKRVAQIKQHSVAVMEMLQLMEGQYEEAIALADVLKELNSQQASKIVRLMRDIAEKDTIIQQMQEQMQASKNNV